MMRMRDGILQYVFREGMYFDIPWDLLPERLIFFSFFFFCDESTCPRGIIDYQKSSFCIEQFGSCWSALKGHVA